MSPECPSTMVAVVIEAAKHPESEKFVKELLDIHAKFTMAMLIQQMAADPEVKSAVLASCAELEVNA